MNNKFWRLIIIWGLLMQSNLLYSQNLFIEYNGSASASNIVGNEQYSYTKTGGGTVVKVDFTVQIPFSENLLYNSQTISGAQVNSIPNYSNYAIQTDQDGLPVVQIELVGSDLTNFSVTRQYSASTNLNFPVGCLDDSYPIRNSLPGNIQQYVYGSTYVQSDNATLRNLALNLVSGSPTIEDALKRIAKWVRGNIGYDYVRNDPQDALTVYNRRTGDCKGYSHLIIALLRAAGIPARYDGGVFLDYCYSIPYRSNQSIEIGNVGTPDFHAFYEVYYPSSGQWIKGDAQMTVNHIMPNVITFTHKLDADCSDISKTITYSGLPPSFNAGHRVNSYIGSLNANYQYITEATYQGNQGGILLDTHTHCIPTGIFDRVEIADGSESFKSGEDVEYYATFTSGDGTTYPVNWDWQLILYHSEGTCVLANKAGGSNLWDTHTDPQLPSYDWLIDPTGKIYGEVQVAVRINDGDIKGATFPISVEECNDLLISNQSYTSSSTLNGCYVVLEDVSVQNNSNLAVNSEKGVTINGDFNVIEGSTFNTNISDAIDLPNVATSSVTTVTCSSATTGGNVTSDGGASVTERGVCWSTSQNPTISDSKISCGSGTGFFSATISPLAAGTTYYVRSYSTNSVGTGYGTQVSYQTPATLPVLAATTIASSITTNSATSGGIVISDGCAAVSSVGLCWSTTAYPTIANSTVNVTAATGTFSANLTGLSPSTTYFVRSFATNTEGTSYGEQISFATATPAVVVPTLASTSSVSTLICSFASTGGNVTSDGGASVTERGICWSTSQNPTTSNSKITCGSGAGAFSGTISPLSAGITYYVRSYATNSAGTGYGAQVSYQAPLTLPVLAATTSATNITINSATSGGNVTSDGCGSVTSRGICWATSQNPTTANSKVVCGSGTGSFTGNLTGLATGTTYYIRSYATNSAGTAYGTQTSFTTSAPSLPILDATGTAYSINYTSAYSSGNITSDGGSTVTNRGLCWSTSSNPTISNSTCSAGSGTGSFTGNLTELSPATTYYIRSFATNSVGTGYGSQTSFTTLTPQIPSLAATTAVTNISATTATSGGNVTSGNGAPVTARGVCWSTSGNPTIANPKTVDGSGVGVFTSNITGLSANTLYYVRAYATSSVGTGYGTQTSFTTMASGITANITVSFLTSGPTYYVVQWNVTLSSPATGNIVIPCITTNETNTGNISVNVNFSAGQTSSGANVVTYTRPIGANFTAYCTFGTMPPGYVAGNTASYVIAKQ